MVSTLLRDVKFFEAEESFCEEIPPLFEHYANDTEELERCGLFKKSKTHVAKLNALNPEPVFGITSMSDKYVKSQETLHKERVITAREEPNLHVEFYQRDVTIVKRSGKWLNMESRN